MKNAMQLKAAIKHLAHNRSLIVRIVGMIHIEYGKRKKYIGPIGNAKFYA